LWHAKVAKCLEATLYVVALKGDIAPVVMHAERLLGPLSNNGAVRQAICKGDLLAPADIFYSFSHRLRVGNAAVSDSGMSRLVDDGRGDLRQVNPSVEDKP
jgi:hypothetical protein